MKDKIIALAHELEPQMIADRRHLHQNPELSFAEYDTMRYICKRLDALGISYQSGVAGTGVLAEISGEQEGGCVLLRADMDALPLEERNQKPYSSQNKGVMHACGHDAHTAILLSVCEIIHRLRTHLSGTVKFVFQPGEETSGGAKPMIDAGVLKEPHVDACAALHMDSDIETGKVRIKSGALYASPDDFYITIKGKGGHGAEPQHTVDPILIAAEIITQLQAIVSRSVNPFSSAVISIGSIHAGDATNIIPDTVKLTGTARALDLQTRLLLERRIEAVVSHACATHGATYDYRYDRLFPPLVNDAEISAQLAESARRYLRDDGCIVGGLPTMAGEDFAYFAEAVPSALFKLGCRNEAKGITAPIHNSGFDLDEAAMKYGAAILADFAFCFLRN